MINWIIKITLFIAMMIASKACSFPSRPVPEISSLRFVPSAFDPFKKNAELKYSLDSETSIDAYIVKKDSLGQRWLVKTLTEDIILSKGTHAHAWLGGNDDGFFVPVGLYYGVIQTKYDLYETPVEVYHE